MLFFVRGLGSGHAIPDLGIAHELRKLRPDVQIAFASYGTGAKTLAEHKAPLVDLQLPEEGDFAEMLVRAGKTIARLTPDLVVSHEETAVWRRRRSSTRPPSMLRTFSLSR